MRNAYVKALYDISSENNDVFTLTADIGVFAFNKIKRDFPKRFFNVGVAEANMIGLAAGLALSGKIPFTFTISSFITMRCLEQIRVDACYNYLPIKMIGAGGGFVYGPQGATHHTIEEIGVLRSIPNMTIVCPADPMEMENVTYASMELKGPMYVRIGRNNEPNLHEKKYDFEIGKADVVKDGSDVTLISTGMVLKNVIDAAKRLEKEGIDAQIINMHTIKPIDTTTIKKCANKTGAIITIEEHNIIGGLGSAVAEIIADENLNISFKRLGINDTFCYLHACYSELQDEYGLSSDFIIDTIKGMLSIKET